MPRVRSPTSTWSSTGAIADVRLNYPPTTAAIGSDVVASHVERRAARRLDRSEYAASTACRVRVSDAASAAVNDISDAVFTISDDDIYEDNDTLGTAAALAPGPMRA